MAIATTNPATGETLKSFEPLRESQLEEKLLRAAGTFRAYRRTSFTERARWMTSAATIIETEKQRFGQLMTTEMGKPFKAAIQEAEKCARVCRYYAEQAERFLSDELIETDATRSYIRYQPIGPVLAVMPWNFPFWQVFRFAAPALMAGNTGLLKHASNVPQCALAIEEIFLRAGFPEGAFQTLLIGSDMVSRVLEDERVAAATLTGSEAAGSQVASTAGKQIKKTVLELGGSDPFIVMPSADLEEAVKTGVKARTINNGQSCIAAKRFIIAAPIYEEYERRFVEEMKSLRIGDPMDEATDIGPLATPQIVKDLDEQVQKSVAKGARLLLGGKPLERPGSYYAPTVLADIPIDAPAYREELFGPVALLFRAPDIDEAIRLANDSTFGLGSSAWTNNEEERARLIDELEAGSVFINGMVASDPRLPFGGVKRSGYGRELSAYGIREFVNIKTVWIKDEAGGNRSETE
ncbi:MAG: succinate-semialdehyde dehydrogenase / glutarate-semialdehyde dehydrogenase [Blastocatellia bacterium]|jgi:succinate-semialdehyde dehydrogenase/glutarate-semialdehyde dehydrogenase|nr:succinate-semialdehyde dehydrogenase / glutarate-semialdehyde dehydrogenase [Blastocatellia bacterium]